jgi:hypothetical protein
LDEADVAGEEGQADHDRAGRVNRVRHIEESMDAVTEIVQPILIALAVLLIPACARFVYKAMSKKLDEGRILAAETAAELKKANADEAARVAAQLEANRAEVMETFTAQLEEAQKIATQRHRDNVDRFDRIEIQTTTTNGQVASHDKQLTALTAQNELLIRLFPGPQQPPKGKPE